MIKEAVNGEFFDFYKNDLFLLEAVTEKLLERIYEIDERRAAMGERKIVDNVRHRIKSPESMRAKLRKRGFAETGESAMKNVCDAAGIRIICPYIDDVYTVADILSRQSDIYVVEVKDYIKRPKDNGYRSYHMIVKTPVLCGGDTHFVTAEIQIRTMVMNSWASAEHQLKYKGRGEADEKSVEMLRRCAEEMYSIDRSMLRIRNMMERASQEDTCKEAAISV